MELHELQQVGEASLAVVHAEVEAALLLAREDKIMFDLLQVAQGEDKALWVPLTLSDQEEAVYQALLPDEPLALLSGNASVKPGLGAVDGWSWGTQKGSHSGEEDPPNTLATPTRNAQRSHGNPRP